MNQKTLIPLAVALVLGLGAAFVARNTMRNAPAATGPAKTAMLVVAKSPLGPGQELTAGDLELVPFASKVPLVGSVSDTSSLVGRVAVTPMTPGQPVLESMLAPQGTAAGLQALIPRGMRAITIDITESTGLAGLVSPGCRVDIVTTALNQEKADRSLGHSIVQNAVVLAVGQKVGSSRADADKDGAQATHTVTLLVSPHDADAIDVANNSSRLRLTLRGSGDTESGTDKGVMLADLRSDAPATQPADLTLAHAPVVEPVVLSPTTRPVVPERPVSRTVTVILGNDEQRLTFTDEPAQSSDVRADDGDAFLH